MVLMNLKTANDFNVFILGDDSQSNTDSEGRVAIAGNATLTNYGIGDKLTASTERADLIVGGTLTASGGENFNGNTVIASLDNVISYTMANGNGVSGQPFAGSPIDFAAETAFLRCASASWAALPANGTADIAYGGLTLTGENEDLNVFQINGANINHSEYTLSDLNKIDIVAPAGSTILINITGAALGFGSYGIFRNGITATGEDGRFILWNLPDATSLAANTTSIIGSLLAPYAAYTSGYSNINGTLIVETLTGNIEAHNYLFAGRLPDTCNDITPPVSGNSCIYEQAITDVIESIALQQTALSHILNAEGEKIQKALAMNLDLANLLLVNDSVGTMVSQISSLEQLLLKKAETAKKICSDNK